MRWRVRAEKIVSIRMRRFVLPQIRDRINELSGATRRRPTIPARWWEHSSRVVREIATVTSVAWLREGELEMSKDGDMNDTSGSRARTISRTRFGR